MDHIFASRGAVTGREVGSTCDLQFVWVKQVFLGKGTAQRLMNCLGWALPEFHSKMKLSRIMGESKKCKKSIQYSESTPKNFESFSSKKKSHLRYQFFQISSPLLWLNSLTKYNSNNEPAYLVDTSTSQSLLVSNA